MEEEKQLESQKDLVEITQNLNLQLKEKQEKIQELEELIDSLSTKFANSIFQFIDILSAIVSFQEKFYENSHSRFVSKYSVKLAKALKMSDEEVFNVQSCGFASRHRKGWFQRQHNDKICP